MKLKVKIKNVYGNRRVYPACEQSQIIADMINRDTFSEFHIEMMERLGYKIVVETPSLY